MPQGPHGNSITLHDIMMYIMRTNIRIRYTYLTHLITMRHTMYTYNTTKIHYTLHFHFTSTYFIHFKPHSLCVYSSGEAQHWNKVATKVYMQTKDICTMSQGIIIDVHSSVLVTVTIHHVYYICINFLQIGHAFYHD